MFSILFSIARLSPVYTVHGAKARLRQNYRNSSWTKMFTHDTFYYSWTRQKTMNLSSCMSVKSLRAYTIWMETGKQEETQPLKTAT